MCFIIFQIIVYHFPFVPLFFSINQIGSSSVCTYGAFRMIFPKHDRITNVWMHTLPSLIFVLVESCWWFLKRANAPTTLYDDSQHRWVLVFFYDSRSKVKWTRTLETLLFRFVRPDWRSNDIGFHFRRHRGEGVVIQCKSVPWSLTYGAISARVIAIVLLEGS